MAVSAIFWTTVNAFDTPSDERVLQAPNGASRDPHQCVLAGHLARALEAQPLAAAKDVCVMPDALRPSFPPSPPAEKASGRAYALS
jgi:hypothetical protein